MKNAMFFVFGMLLFASPVVAQISPRPVAEAEIRDSNSIRMRSLQLERVKRDSKKTVLPEPTKEQIIKLAEIKEDFEDIQKLQSIIVKTYTTGKTINFGKIGDSAARLSKRALRLDLNLFGLEAAEDSKTKSPKEVKKRSVRDLIIELDNAIGSFVNSPVFASDKLIDLKASEQSEISLQKIIRLSELLSTEARNR